MCYIFKLFYLCASSTKSNKRTEESQKSNLDGNSQGVVAASKEASRKQQQQQLDGTAQNVSVATKIPIKSELSEFINASAGGNESQFGLKKLEFNETEIYEIEAANKALLDKPAKSSKSKSSGRDKKSSSSSHQKSATTATAAANHQASSSSASCSSSSVVAAATAEAEKKQALPVESNSSYSLYEYVRETSSRNKHLRLRKENSTLEEFATEENYFNANENESILNSNEKNKSSYLDFLQLSTNFKSNAFDYSSLDRFSMTEMEPASQPASNYPAELANSAVSEKGAVREPTGVLQAPDTPGSIEGGLANRTDTNSLNSEASSSSLSNDPRQFLSNNQKPLIPNENLLGLSQISFNSLNLTENQIKKFINPAQAGEPSDRSNLGLPDSSRATGAAKVKLELLKSKFNVSIDNSNLYNNLPMRLANELSLNPNEPNRIISTSTELINNTPSPLAARAAGNNSSNNRLNMAAAGPTLTLGDMSSRNLSTSLSIFNGPSRVRPPRLGETGVDFGINLSTPKLDNELGGVGGGMSSKGPVLIKLQQPELKLDQLKKKKQGFYFETNNLLAMPSNDEQMPDDRELSSILDGEISNSMSELIEEDVMNASASSLHPHRSKNRYASDVEKTRRVQSSKLDYTKLQKAGKLTIATNQVYEFKESELEDLGQIGHGEFGSVHKVLHKPSNTYMALKRIGPTVGNQGERKKVLKELDFVLECHEYEYVVKFYGVKFNNEPADCLICMELMDTSLEKFYKFIYEKKNEEIPESILGKIVIATVNALNYLKEQHRIIHRDVKPSNILVSRSGMIKMCDFGISGKLVDSIAASRDAGCQLYMAPERIDPERACTHGYDVRSDVWSLGITLYELATGKFPYPQWKTIFHQLNLVVGSDAPRLESARLSAQFKNFVNTCLTKDEKKRPKYKTLLEHELVAIHTASNVNVAAYVAPYIEEMFATKLIR